MFLVGGKLQRDGRISKTEPHVTFSNWELLISTGCQGLAFGREIKEACSKVSWCHQTNQRGMQAGRLAGRLAVSSLERGWNVRAKWYDGALEPDPYLLYGDGVRLGRGPSLRSTSRCSTYPTTCITTIIVSQHNPAHPATSYIKDVARELSGGSSSTYLQCFLPRYDMLCTI